MTGIIGFDIETSGEAVADISNTHIICAALWSSEVGAATVVYGAQAEGEGMYAPQLSRSEAATLVNTLAEHWHAGDIIVTWNGTGFDWPILAQESGLFDDCVSLAMHSIDPAFLMLCTKGFMIGLDAAAKGAGLSGKLEGLSGAMAPILWKRSLDEQRKVLKYVAQDARITGQAYMKAIEQGYLTWTATSGKKNVWQIPTQGERMMAVEEALSLPLPDVSWMTNPRTRESCIAWMAPKVEQPQTPDAPEPCTADRTRITSDGVLMLDLVNNRAAQVAAYSYSHAIYESNPDFWKQLKPYLTLLV